MSLQARFKSPSPPIPQFTQRLFSLKESAVYLGVRLWTVRQLCRSGQLSYQLVGKHRGWMIDRLDLDRFIEKQKGIAAAEGERAA